MPKVDWLRTDWNNWNSWGAAQWTDWFQIETSVYSEETLGNVSGQRDQGALFSHLRSSALVVTATKSQAWNFVITWLFRHTVYYYVCGLYPCAIRNSVSGFSKHCRCWNTATTKSNKQPWLVLTINFAIGAWRGPETNSLSAIKCIKYQYRCCKWTHGLSAYYGIECATSCILISAF